MKISVHVERLVLEGLPVSVSERPLLQAAIEAELTRLLRNGGLADEFRAGSALTQVPAGAVRVGTESSPTELGTDIAHAVHRGLSHRSRRPSVRVGRRFSVENRRSLPAGNPR